MTLEFALLVLISLARLVECGEPVFDPATLMRLVLVPADAAVGSVIYRVRASDPDFDYPLQFELVGQMGRLDVSIETLPCTRYNSICQANVILLRRLEPGRYVDFRVSVRNTRGRSNRIACSITGTNATTPRDTIFPHQPGLILVPEDAKRGMDLEIVIARKNPTVSKPLELELWGSQLFAIRQRRVSSENTEGTIFLLGPLDFETQSMYHLTLLAVEPYVEVGKDTRNIAALEIVVVVQDIQDMPPVFTHAPPITHLAKRVVPGDVVVRVRAEDGDKGAPRQIRYGLVSEGNPFTPFFNINETSGELTLERPVEEIAAISHAGTPILLTVIAEEVRLSREEPEAMSTTVQLAFILPERDNTPPYFENEFYITYLDENSPQGTALVFNDPYIPQVSDNDAGKNGVFSLTLIGNNGTFEISPTVAERNVEFIIKVRDNTMLDYEARKSVIFQILAQELGPATNLSATTNVTVYLNDVNDNAPVFIQQSYDVELPENVTAGTRVTQVAADDVDTGLFGKIQYTAILGYLNTSLHLDPITGVITIATNNHGFDREAMPDLHFLVEARDNDGVGIRVTVPLIIKLLDVNDNPPQFERSLYEFVLSPSLNNFTSKAYVKASDKDSEPPNNIVRYEIIQGNTERKLAINADTGELYLLEALKRVNIDKDRKKRQFESDEQSEVYVLTIRAYDLGIPRQFSTTLVKIYPPESKSKTLLFIVPGGNPDPKKTEEILGTITGGRVTILEIRPYKGNEVGATDVSTGSTSQEKSVVVATVFMTGNQVIDVSHIKDQLTKNKTLLTTSSSGDSSNTNNQADTTNTLSSESGISGNNGNSGFYKAENRILFWILILLAILIALALLSLILCCICEGCPLYMPPRKRVIRVNSTEDDVHLMAKSRVNRSMRNIQNDKTLEADWGKREAWSAEQTDVRTKPTQWKFNKRDINEYPKPASTPGDFKGREFIISAIKAGDGENINRHREGPNIIFTKEMQLQDAYDNKHREYMEDLENGYDRIATLHNRQDDNSLQRHEIARGSHHRASPARDQYYIKEGDTEILRLVTRGKNEDERYVNLPPPRPVTLLPPAEDSGKDLLLRRFIREQDVENQRRRNEDHMERASLRDTKGAITQEILESSLRKQNELLHQILADREKLLQAAETASQVESRLETQSLPGHAAMATQTECHAGTQTDEQRKAVSDNESYSEEEATSSNPRPPSLAWLKRRKPKKKIKYKDHNPRRSVREIRRKIRTPILEETELSPGQDEKCVKVKKTNKIEEYTKNYLDAKKSIVRKSKNEVISSTEIKIEDGQRKSGLRREVLLEISDSLDEQLQSKSKLKLKKPLPRMESDEESENRRNKSSEENDKNSRKSRQNQSSTSDAQTAETGPENAYETIDKTKIKQKSSSTSSTESKSKDDLQKVIKAKPESTKTSQKSIPRYMQWYGKKENEPPPPPKKVPDKPKRITKLKKDTSKSTEDENPPANYGKIVNTSNSELKKTSKTKDKEFIHPRILKEEQVTPVPQCTLPDVHPLLQHSEHRYEHQYENQNPLCYIQPTHMPQYLGNQSQIPNFIQRQMKEQPIYVNQDETKDDEINEIKEKEIVSTSHNISISTSLDDNRKSKKGVHVQKIKIGGDDDSNTLGSKIDDNDSGIAMNSLGQKHLGLMKRIPITEKKSVFTIAYDDVHTKQLRPDSSSTSY